jgi:hypothetical protein
VSVTGVIPSAHIDLRPRRSASSSSGTRAIWSKSTESPRSLHEKHFERAWFRCSPESVGTACWDKALLTLRLPDTPSDRDPLEPEVGLEATTCALRGRSAESRSVSLRLALSQSVLAEEALCRCGGIVRD